MDSSKSNIKWRPLILFVGWVFLSNCADRGPEERIEAEEDGTWRDSVRTNISFPLASPITVTVGTRSSPQSSAQETETIRNVSMEWLEKQTNIHFEFQPMGGRFWRMIDFPEMVSEGTLPDLMKESLVEPKDDSVRALFVNVLEFPELTPNFNSLLKADELFLLGTLGRLEKNNELYSLGEYSSGTLPHLGAIAFREDVFSKEGLSYDTWGELFESLKRLKNSFPESYPIGATPDAIFNVIPSWFRSGYHQKYAAYFHVERNKWVFGPFESEFEEYIRYFATLYRENLLHPYTFNPPPDQSYPGDVFARDKIFVAQWHGSTGLSFQYRFRVYGRNYGDLTEDGNWDGNGAWISAMKIPKNRDDKRGWLSSDPWTNVASGWIINEKSIYIGELLALFDFLYREDVALALQFGPEGLAWEYRDGEPVLKSTIKTTGNPQGEKTLSEYLSEQNLEIGSPINGLRFDPTDLLGVRNTASYRYYVSNEIEAYYGTGSLITQPLPMLTADDRTIKIIIANVARIMRILDIEIIDFIMGRRPLDEYELFVEELHEAGAGTLVDMLNRNTITPRPEVLLGRM